MKSQISLRFSRIGTAHRHVAKQMLFIAVFVLLGKVAGAAKEMSIAFRYGVVSLVDIYVLVFTVVTWLPSVWASVLNSVFVPLTLSLEQKERNKFNAEVSGLIIGIGLVVCILLMIVAPTFIPEPVGENASGASRITTILVYGLAPTVLLSFLVCQYNAQLLAQEKHVNTLLEGVPSFCLLFVILFWPVEGSVYPFVWGSLLGVFLHALILALLLWREGQLSIPRFSFLSSAWAKFRSALGIMIVSQVVISVVPIIDHWVVSGLGEGSNSILGYTMRLLALLMGLGATAVGRAILPVLSNSDNSKHRIEFSLKWFWLLFVIGVGVSVVAWFGTPIVVKLIYQRGAFEATDTLAVVSALRMGLLQLAFYFSGIVLVQLFASERLYKVLLMSSILAVVIKLLTGYFLTMRFGVPGIMLSSALMYLATCSFLLFSTLRHRKVSSRSGMS